MSDTAMSTARAALRADVPLMLWGPPGGGKSAWAASSGRPTTGIPAGQLLDSGDMLVPVVDRRAGLVRRLPLAEFAAQPGGVLVIDDLPDARPAVMAAILDVIQHRRLGSLKIDNVQIICTGNPPASNVRGSSLPPAVANRMAHVEFRREAGAYPPPPPPIDPPDRSALLRAEAVCEGFGRRQPPDASQDGPDALGRQYSWRSLSYVARLVAAGCDWLHAATACIGPAVAVALADHAMTARLPDPEDVLAGRAQMPRETHSQWSLAAVMIRASIDARDARVWRALAQCDMAVGAALVGLLRELIHVVPPDEAGRAWLEA